MRLFQKTGSDNEQIATVAGMSTSGLDEDPHTSKIDWSRLHDRALCHGLSSGTPDEQSQAFGVLYDRYELMIRNYVMKQLNYNEEDSFETIGDTWLVFWRERMNFRWQDDAQTENPLQSWLYGIARNRIKSKIRKNQRERETVSAVSLDLVSNFIVARLEDNAFDWVSSPSSNSGADEPEIEALSNRHFNRLMKQLNSTEQQVVTLRYYKGLTYTEISQQLGKSSAAVRTAHTRLIQKLRKKLDALDLDGSMKHHRMEK